MLTAREATKALYGAYRLARFDAGGMAHFDTSIAGFWRSFYAAAIVLPFYVIFLGLRYSAGLVDSDPLRYSVIEAIAYVIAWVTFPLIMVAIARLLDRDDRYLRYIVAYNWAAVWQNAVYIPVAALSLVGVMAVEEAVLLSMVVLGLILVYSWFVARTALDITAVTAAGIVVLDLVVSLFINGFVQGLLQR